MPGQYGKTWSQLLWSCRLQFRAMAAASSVFLAGGLKLGWCVFEPPTRWFLNNTHSRQLIVSWFIGVIFGAMIASVCVQRFTKHFAHCTSGLLLIAGGILFAFAPRDFSSLLCGCLCEGCAYGLTQVQAVITGGEVSHKRIRGLLLSSERFFLWLGICLQLLITRLWFAFEPANGYSLNIDQVHGILVASLGLITIGLTLIHRLESPLLLHMKQHDLAATYTLQVLNVTNDGSYTDSETQHTRMDYKQMLDCENEHATLWQIFCKCNAVPLIKLITLRTLIAISISLPFNRAFFTLCSNGFSCGINCMLLIAVCGLCGTIVGGFLVDHYGRRKLAFATLMPVGVFLCIVGGIFGYLQTTDKIPNALIFLKGSSLLMLSQFLTCTGIGVTSTVYAGEAFSTRVKAKCVAIVLAWEQLLIILLTFFTFYTEYSNAGFFFAIGSLNLFLGLLVFIVMPETKQLRLGECLIEFKKLPK